MKQLFEFYVFPRSVGCYRTTGYVGAEQHFCRLGTLSTDDPCDPEDIDVTAYNGLIVTRGGFCYVRLCEIIFRSLSQGTMPKSILINKFSR